MSLELELDRLESMLGHAPQEKANPNDNLFERTIYSIKAMIKSLFGKKDKEITPEKNTVPFLEEEVPSMDNKENKKEVKTTEAPQQDKNDIFKSEL